MHICAIISIFGTTAKSTTQIFQNIFVRCGAVQIKRTNAQIAHGGARNRKLHGTTITSLITILYHHLMVKKQISSVLPDLN